MRREAFKVVSCFVTCKGKVLILKRSQKVRTYGGRWAAVSGYLEKGEDPLDRAFRELSEEVGLLREDVELVRKGEPISVADSESNLNWIVYPFLFNSKTNEVRIDWEHDEYKWINPEDLRNYETVPMLKEALLSILK
ncbi:MAG: NUDIX pyrophosphatase [Candidatus Atabeyarchaeum deiterrae]